MATTMQPVIGSNLRVSDVEYTPNQLKELKTQLDADKNILRDIFKESHPKLSEKESTRRFNKLYNSLLKNFKPFISDFKLPSKPTESDVVKWMISEGKKKKIQLFSLPTSVINLLLKILTPYLIYIKSNLLKM